ncbi:MAG TPA: glycosyltransferase [Gemmatimonadales bacterium]|nr:glycosyltransferase [Gemmatimonadales bacterium]
MQRQFRSVAVINPLADYGISEYSHELAEGLCANGVRVDLYTTAIPTMAGRPRRHRLFPVLGSPLFRQRALVERRIPAPARKSSFQPANGVAVSERVRDPLLERVRRFFLPVELALHLRRRGYDLVWTQWPFLGPYGVGFLSACRSLGLPVLHTVHNVLPHEPEPGDDEICRRVYRTADALVVHSEQSRAELAAFEPATIGKTIVAPHGLYEGYPRRPERRDAVRRELDLPTDAPVILMFGALRPYKNVDAVLESLRDPRLAAARLIVAGRERKFPDLVPGDLVGRTRRLAAALGVLDRIRPLPGPFDHERTAELFEASDIVALPYLRSYGSGQLLLAMTFGKHVAATPVGGAAEYCVHYPRHTLLSGPSVPEVAAGLAEAAATVASGREAPAPPRVSLDRLRWPTVARRTLEALSALTARRPGSAN